MTKYVLGWSVCASARTCTPVKANMRTMSDAVGVSAGEVMSVCTVGQLSRNFSF